MNIIFDKNIQLYLANKNIKITVTRSLLTSSRDAIK